MTIKTIYQCDVCGTEAIKPNPKSMVDPTRYWLIENDAVYCPMCKHKRLRDSFAGLSWKHHDNIIKDLSHTIYIDDGWDD